MEIKTVFIIGAGTMGVGIAQVIAEKGYHVYLNDISEELAVRAITGLDKRLSKRVEKGSLTEENKQIILDRISIHTEYKDAADCQLVIEAATERMDIKKAIFKSLDSVCVPGTLLATNSSSLSITDISSVLSNPENFIGIHFFNPVSTMKLIELIRGFCTSDETNDVAYAFCKSLGKIVVKAKDGPGFLVNRMLTMLTTEAVNLLELGYGSIEDIDTSMVYGSGHPMGPLTLIDLVGVDISLAVAETLYAETGDSRYRVPLLLKKMVRAGYLGQKTGKGFYIYDNAGNKAPNPNISQLN